MDAVRVEGLTRRFGNHVAVQDLRFRVPQGRIFGYLGLNGAGKTTTIRMLTTLLRPTSGRAWVLGADVAEEPLRVRRLVGLVGDDGGDSQPAWSPREYLGYFAILREIADRRRATEQALDAVGIEAAWRRRAMGSFSTGMKRRVELARALLGRPRVLFLDEPTRGLDLPAKRRVWSLLKSLAANEKVTIFLSSHETTEIAELCDDLAVLRRGRLAFLGQPRALAAHPRGFEQRLIELLASPEPARSGGLATRAA